MNLLDLFGGIGGFSLGLERATDPGANRACSAGALNMSDWTTEYLTMLDDCEKREDRLTEWECGFIDSLRSYIAAGRRPTG